MVMWKKKRSKSKVDSTVSNQDASGKDEDDAGKVKPSSKKKSKKAVGLNKGMAEDTSAVLVGDDGKQSKERLKTNKDWKRI